MHSPRRRHFITASIGSATSWFLAKGDHTNQFVSTNKKRVQLRFFDTEQALNIAAAAERILPGDSSGPGASDAGVIIYIDRQLAGPYGADRHRYKMPPFVEGSPEQGYQGQATPREIYLNGLKTIGDKFHAFPPDIQDAHLLEIENTYFFRLLRQHTIEGMFCDPIHGGNHNLVGWRLIGYPGPQMDWTQHVEAHYGEEFRPSPKSLEELLSRRPRASEDEV